MSMLAISTHDLSCFLPQWFPPGVSPTMRIAFLTALASSPESQSIAPKTASMVVANKLCGGTMSCAVTT